MRLTKLPRRSTNASPPQIFTNQISDDIREGLANEIQKTHNPPANPENKERNRGQARKVMLHLISGRKSKAKEGILSHSRQLTEGGGEG